MTDASTQTPAGWYAAPDGTPAMWWWDGVRWIQPPQPVRPAAASGAVAKLAIATQVLLIACGVVSVATIALEAFGITAIADYLDGSPTAFDRITAYDTGTTVISLLTGLTGIAAGVLWAVWQFQAAKQFVGRTWRSPAWHAGSWFIPIACLWLPYQNISDLWRVSGRTRPSWQIVWWLLWIVGSYVVNISGSVCTPSPMTSSGSASQRGSTSSAASSNSRLYRWRS